MTRTRTASRKGGIRETAIPGGFIAISPMQICLAWYLYQSKTITKRQLRIYFAAFEMLERRKHGGEDAPDKPLFRIEELSRLVGGQGSSTALTELRADVKRLAQLRLVHIADHEISIAASIDQIALDDTSGFFAFFDEIPNRRRPVPVPRRLLRALAGGFSKACTGLILCFLLRGLFWHKATNDFRTDGRTKLTWLAETFGISRRALTDARTRLIELGWIEPIETNAYERKRWGVHDRINLGFAANDEPGVSAGQNSENPGESAGLSNQSLLSSRESKNQNLRGSRPNPSAVCLRQTRKTGSRERKQSACPSIHDIQPQHLRHTEDLLELHKQAIDVGMIDRSESARLDFLAMAERARSRGDRPGALLTWLLQHENGRLFITQADEDAAQQRLREWREGPAIRDSDQESRPAGQGRGAQLSERDRTVMAIIRVSNERRLEPSDVARQVKGWSRQEWEEAHWACQQAQLKRQSPEIPG